MNKWTGLLEQIERYLRTQNNEDLCNDSADLIDFIETVRDDELIRRMEQAGDKQRECRDAFMEMFDNVISASGDAEFSERQYALEGRQITSNVFDKQKYQKINYLC